MARVYPYRYEGRLRTKQEKPRASVPLDKPRIRLDFGECCAAVADGAPVYLFSRADIVSDSEGNDTELREGLVVGVFDEDFDDAHGPDPLLADGVVLKNDLGVCPEVTWLVRLLPHGRECASGTTYVYWMSDLR